MNLWNALLGALICYVGYLYGQDAYRNIRAKQYVAAAMAFMVSVWFIATSIDVVTDSQFTWITQTVGVITFIVVGAFALGFLVDCWRDLAAKRWDSAGAGFVIVIGIGLMLLTQTIPGSLMGMLVFIIGLLWRRKYDAQVPEGRFSSKIFVLGKLPKKPES